ncbi:OLC1v1013186C1 [Oldenlandia corymbosa var. corymbosa]|uniref:OLC1v1013186C1 n=1 Tax=Oldenlandia corymbosa var. corymbosa TaxID=529605 RepID=A0AAV1E1B4_OLDCO|nr:OLC1v1013186C1 [Oldenlandia corymbosa var. corymbosa]
MATVVKMPPCNGHRVSPTDNLYIALVFEKREKESENFHISSAVHWSQLSVITKMKFPTQALKTFGFHIDQRLPKLISGRLQITQKCCPPFGALHGGLSAMIAEEIGDYGAYLASGKRKPIGIQLNINHLKSAEVGDIVLAEATPVNAGRTIQVFTAFTT